MIFPSVHEDRKVTASRKRNVAISMITVAQKASILSRNGGGGKNKLIVNGHLTIKFNTKKCLLPYVRMVSIFKNANIITKG